MVNSLSLRTFLHSSKGILTLPSISRNVSRKFLSPVRTSWFSALLSVSTAQNSASSPALDAHAIVVGQEVVRVAVRDRSVLPVSMQYSVAKLHATRNVCCGSRWHSPSFGPVPQRTLQPFRLARLTQSERKMYFASLWSWGWGRPDMVRVVFVRWGSWLT